MILLFFSFLLFFSCSNPADDKNLSGNTTETTNVVQATVLDQEGKQLKTAHLFLHREINGFDSVFSVNLTKDSNFSVPPGEYHIEIYNPDSSQGWLFKTKILEDSRWDTIQLKPTFQLAADLQFDKNKFDKFSIIGTGHSSSLLSESSIHFQKVPAGNHLFKISGEKTQIDSLDLRNPPQKVNLIWQQDSSPLLSFSTQEAILSNYWSFENPDTAFITDEGPFSIVGYISGTIKYQLGYKGNAIFLGKNSHLHFSNPPDFFHIQPNEDFAFYLRFLSPETITDTLTLLSTLALPDYGFSIKLTPTNSYAEIKDYDQYSLKIPSLFSAQKDVWHSVLFFRKGNTYGLKFDDQTETLRYAAISHEFTGGILNLGVDDRYYQFFEGAFDEVYFFKGFPSDSLIKSLE